MYYMPRVDDNTFICNSGDRDCYENIKLAIELATNDSFVCNCLPGCYEVSYNAETTLVKLGDKSYITRSQSLLKDFTTDYIQ